MPTSGRESQSGNTSEPPRDPKLGESLSQGDRKATFARLDDRYENAVTASEKRKISEEFGELGGLRYLEVRTGRPLKILRPTTDEDVADLVSRFNSGRAWDDVVAYRGRNATNLVHYDGKTLHIVEAKGGAGKYGSRNRVLQDGTTVRISQTDPTYPKDIAEAMFGSARTDGRNQLGDLAIRSYSRSHVSYTGVRTSGHERPMPKGKTQRAISIFVEHIFLEAPPPL